MEIGGNTNKAQMQNQQTRHEHWLHFLAGFLLHGVKEILFVLPWKVLLCISFIGLYFVYQLFSWKTLYVISGLLLVYYLLSFWLSWEKIKSNERVVKHGLQIQLQAHILNNSTTLKIAELNAAAKEKEATLELERGLFDVNCKRHEIDRKSKTEMQRIQKTKVQ